ncbi:ImmA/IrrE family metallo-endopeptidase [Enterococcus mundtii]|uniref:ImmA/IrrE family metallo-endopeptidase n=1 Tax=Enterococcus mundtii TaxID=53346 RepID=A0A848MX64_ENTMU|nr:ImmA/IrrE family metallo-endopeptidase [Enterococcus mundtii]MEC3942412.1 ImmA/IrrE family metallo-endopeptidase [Enterococcus mundtii]NMP58500.1 ImmA/IrrE family metallo-endopeptidase [Enterococcus mundtii]
MYNRETYEYREIDSYDYKLYSENAHSLLLVISDWAETPISEITYFQIVEFFVEHFEIEIIFFDSAQCPFESPYHFFNNKIYEVSSVFKKRVSGFTVTDGRSYKIFLQKYRNRQRIVFTLLHELVHIYFHCSDNSYTQIFASMDVDGHYPDEILPFEDEANVIASILYLNNEKLVEYFDEGLSFDLILVNHCISKRALHNRINNFLIYDLGLNPKVAFFNYLKPYREEVYGDYAITQIQTLMSMPKNLYF